MSNETVTQWKEELEAMGFCNFVPRGHMPITKVTSTAILTFYIGENENERFVYENRLSGRSYEPVEIAGINTPADVRKFLDAVGEL